MQIRTPASMNRLTHIVGAKDGPFSHVGTNLSTQNPRISYASENSSDILTLTRPSTVYQALEERIGIFSAQSVIDTIARNQKQFTEVGALTHMLIEHQIEWYMLVREQHEKAFSFQLAKSPDHNFVYGSQGKSVARKLGFLERFNRVA